MLQEHARIQGMGREDTTFAPDYRDFMPAAQSLGTAALAYLRRREISGGLLPMESSMAELWGEYRKAIEEITNDERFGAARMMSLDWHESTGDAHDALLVPQLAIVQERMALARYFEERPDLAAEFNGAVRRVFLDYGRRVVALVRGERVGLAAG